MSWVKQRRIPSAQMSPHPPFITAYDVDVVVCAAGVFFMSLCLFRITSAVTDRASRDCPAIE